MPHALSIALGPFSKLSKRLLARIFLIFLHFQRVQPCGAYQRRRHVEVFVLIPPIDGACRKRSKPKRSQTFMEIETLNHFNAAVVVIVVVRRMQRTEGMPELGEGFQWKEDVEADVVPPYWMEYRSRPRYLVRGRPR